jgi:3-dehydroquinate synthase
MEGVMRHISASAGGAAYEILIGESILPGALRGEALRHYESVAVIASSRVYDLHRAYIDESLEALRGRFHFLLMDDLEENKSYAMAGRFLESFIEKKLTRRSAVIGIGGGVVGDFAGFCAGLYMRGIPVVQVPTTLLAMVDSSIGGKVAVNLSVGKNIAGLFRQPSLVISDVRFLETLPDREFRDGLTEAFKHGLIGDAGTLSLFEGSDPAAIRKPERVGGLVALSASFKSGIVEQDEREQGRRAILNFGHTVAHAIESFCGYRGVSHGGAVAAGIVVMVEVSRRLGLLSDIEAARAREIINEYGLAAKLSGLDIDGVIEHMLYDKKNFGGSVNFVLLGGLGNPEINMQVPVDMLKKAMAEIIC